MEESLIKRNRSNNEGYPGDFVYRDNPFRIVRIDGFDCDENSILKVFVNSAYYKSLVASQEGVYASPLIEAVLFDIATCEKIS